MSPETFRELGYRMIDHVADYWARVGSLPVRSQAEPADVLAALPEFPPEAGLADDPGAWDPIFDDLARIIEPALTHWQSPRFFAFFPANVSGPSVLGELLSAGLGVQGMLWLTSPACTELETRVLDWMARALGLPERFLSTACEGGSPSGGGVIQGTASEATLTALVAARDRARRRWRAVHGDQPLPATTLYASDQAHSSVIKAAMIAGLAETPEDRTHVRLIPVRGDYSIDPAELRRALEKDRAAGRLPIFVCATAGTTGTTAFDPIPEVAAAVAGATRPWLHVDAAHAGAAAVCPEFRWILHGVEHADSLCFNPHKWLLTNFDCDCFFTSDRRSLVRALAITPSYLQNSASAGGGVIDYRDWQVPLGRRFRALKLWFVMRHYGLAGLREHIRRHVEWAAEAEGAIAGDPRFEVITPRRLNLVCFRLRPAAGETREQTDARNRSLLDRLNASGRVFLTHAVLPVHDSTAYVLRLCVGSASTTRADVQETVGLILRGPA